MGIWPQSVLTRFATIPVNPSENDIYPPYSKLLNILFPPDGPFTVGPLSNESSREHNTEYSNRPPSHASSEGQGELEPHRDDVPRVSQP